MVNLRSMNLEELVEQFELWCEEDLSRVNFRWITHISKTLHPELRGVISYLASHRGEIINLERLKNHIIYKCGNIGKDDAINREQYIELIISIIELDFGSVVYDN